MYQGGVMASQHQMLTPTDRTPPFPHLQHFLLLKSIQVDLRLARVACGVPLLEPSPCRGPSPDRRLFQSTPDSSCIALQLSPSKEGDPTTLAECAIHVGAIDHGYISYLRLSSNNRQLGRAV